MKDQVADFSIQLVQEFLSRKGLTESASMLQTELQQLGIITSTAIWAEMYERCNLPTTNNDSSTIEALVQYLLLANEKGPSYEPLVNVLASPKKKSRSRPEDHESKSSSQSGYAAAYASRIVRPSLRLQLETKSDVVKEQQQEEKKVVESVPRVSSRKSKPKVKKKPATTSSPIINLSPIKTIMSRDTKVCLDRTTYIIRKELMDQRRQEQEEVKKLTSQHLNRPQIVQKDKFKQCSLCQQSFPIQHLQFQISYKGIMDLHEKWGYVDPNPNNGRSKPPLCYDRVPVCLFCAQLLQDSLETFESNPEVKKKMKNKARGPKEITDPLSLPPLDPDVWDDTTIASMDQKVLRSLRRASACKIEAQEADHSSLRYVAAKLESETKMSANEWNIIKHEEEDSKLMQKLRRMK